MVDQKSQQGQFAMPQYDARTYAPQFTNPWNATAAAPTGVYQNQIAQATSPTIPQPHQQQQQQQQAFSRPGSISIPTYQQTPTSANSNQSSFSVGTC